MEGEGEGKKSSVTVGARWNLLDKPRRATLGTETISSMSRLVKKEKKKPSPPHGGNNNFRTITIRKVPSFGTIIKINVFAVEVSRSNEERRKMNEVKHEILASATVGRRPASPASSNEFVWKPVCADGGERWRSRISSLNPSAAPPSAASELNFNLTHQKQPSSCFSFSATLSALCSSS